MIEALQDANTGATASLIVGVAFKGLLLVLAAWTITLMLRRSPASRRHMTWTIAAVGLLLIPVMVFALPSLEVTVPQWWPAGEIAQTVERERLFAPAEDALELAEPVEELNRESAAETPLVATGSKSPDGEATTASFLTRWLPIIWCLGAFVSLIVPVTGLWQVSLLRRRGNAVGDPELLEALNRAMRQVGLRRNVRLMTSNRCSTPLTWGVLWPVILLPKEWSDWSANRLRMVLLRELGHIKRFDWFTQMMAQLACAVHWFNPLAWMVGRRMQVERELACDDLVLRTGTTASDYAGELLYFADRLRGAAFLTMGAVPMARKSSLEQRVRGVLDVNRKRTGLTKVVLVAAMLLGLGALVPLAMLRAEAVQGRSSVVVSKDGLTALSVAKGKQPEYTILYVGEFKAELNFAENIKAGTWTDSGVLRLKDAEVNFQINHSSRGQLMIGGFQYSVSAGRVFIIDTITPPDMPFQILQVDADVPVASRDNLEKIFEESHQPGFLPMSTGEYSTEYPKGSRRTRHLEWYQRHDAYRARFVFLHGTNNSTRDINGTNDSRDKSWVIDDTLHLENTDVRLRCKSATADRLLIGEREFDLKKGRVFSLDSMNQPVQHAIFPRVLRTLDELVRLNKQIEGKVAPKNGRAIVDKKMPGTKATRLNATDDLKMLIELLKKRDESLRQMYYAGTVTVAGKMDTERRKGESDAEFVKRQTSRKPELNGVVRQVVVAQDFDLKTEHTIYGVRKTDLDFTEVRFDGTKTTESKGRGRPTWTMGKSPELDESTMMLPRLDILAFRPVRNHPLHPIIDQASRVKEKAFASKRPPFKIERTRPSQGAPGRWVVTFQRMEQEEGTNRRESLWFRLFFEQRADTVVITRVDELYLVDVEELPPGVMDARTVTLLEKYQEVSGVLVPHQARIFTFGNNFMLGTQLKLQSMRVNDKESIPDKTSVQRDGGLKALFGLD